MYKIFCRSWQGSNLRGQSPLDFKSNALTTRPQLLCLRQDKNWRCGGSNPGPFTCKANALPLSYIPYMVSRLEIWERLCLRNCDNEGSNQHWVALVLVWVTSGLKWSIRLNSLMTLSILTCPCVYGHIMLKTPVLVRSLKLSNIESR